MGWPSKRHPFPTALHIGSVHFSFLFIEVHKKRTVEFRKNEKCTNLREQYRNHSYRQNLRSLTFRLFEKLLQQRKHVTHHTSYRYHPVVSVS